jgi:hypothetical protein
MHEAPIASVAPHVVVSEKRFAPAPLRLSTPSVSGAVPLSVKVTVANEVEPAVTEGTVTVVAVNVAAGVGTAAVPVNCTEEVPPNAALLLTVRNAVKVPAVDEAKVMVTLQLAPAARLPVQVLVCVKSEAFVPVIATEDTLIECKPGF